MILNCASSNLSHSPVLEMREAGVSYFSSRGEIPAIPKLNLSLYEGEALGIVGESGCGKSSLAFAVMRYLGVNGQVVAGDILFRGRSLLAMPEAELQHLRGSQIAMVYQDSASALNPMMTIGRQLSEVSECHRKGGRKDSRDRALLMLREVRIAEPEHLLDRYPHQLSGGQQQRVVIAMALMAEPALLILDEPTTGLDVTVEAAILDIIRDLRQRRKTAILFISHNLHIVAQVCDRVGVMYGGDIIETGPVEKIFRNPRHPYTQGLLACQPRLSEGRAARRLLPIPGTVITPEKRPRGCYFQDRCHFRQEGICDQEPLENLAIGRDLDHYVRCPRHQDIPDFEEGAPLSPSRREAATEPILEITRLHKIYRYRRGLFGKANDDVKAVQDVTIRVGRSSTLGVVGESGSGKSTLAKILAGAETASSGHIRFDQEDIAGQSVEHRRKAIKQAIQMIFQNPDQTLNPSHTVGYTLMRAIKQLGNLAQRTAPEEAALALLEMVRLPSDIMQQKPEELSGGQKQRIAIARALAGQPQLVIADEPVSALDVSVQAAIINLLEEIQSTADTSLIFISHDLALVRYLAEWIAVMYRGHVVEFGSAEEVFRPPYHPYMAALLASMGERKEREKASSFEDGGGPEGELSLSACPYAKHCQHKLGPVCGAVMPPKQQLTGDHWILCHRSEAELPRENR